MVKLFTFFISKKPKMFGFKNEPIGNFFFLLLLLKGGMVVIIRPGVNLHRIGTTIGTVCCKIRDQDAVSSTSACKNEDQMSWEGDGRTGVWQKFHEGLLWRVFPITCVYDKGKMYEASLQRSHLSISRMKDIDFCNKLICVQLINVTLHETRKVGLSHR